jgi:hypothetical protein
MARQIRNDGIQPVHEGHQPGAIKGLQPPIQKIVMPSGMIKGLQPSMSSPPPSPPATGGNISVARPKK